MLVGTGFKITTTKETFFHSHSENEDWENAPSFTPTAFHGKILFKNRGTPPIFLNTQIWLYGNCPCLLSYVSQKPKRTKESLRSFTHKWVQRTKPLLYKKGQQIIYNYSQLENTHKTVQCFCSPTKRQSQQNQLWQPNTQEQQGLLIINKSKPKLVWTKIPKIK